MTLILWIKALHVIAVISWMAGMFYLPRLYVYHADAKPGSELSETFKVMERRLLRVIINPAMLLVWITGPLLAWLEGVYMEPWFHAKVALVVVMSGLHGALSRWRRDFAEDRNTRSARFFRIANEVPPLLMVLIVILVILKPF
jgi:putative membrane protein